jgi:hypothetical protein
LKNVLAAREDFRLAQPRMKKLAYLVVALGLLSVGLLAGCQKQADMTPASPDSTNMPSTNAPSTNAP